MAVTTANLAMGPGELYVGDFDADEPLDTEVNNTPASSAWDDVGGTMGGLTLSIANTWKELEVDQVTETPERRRTKKEVSLKTQLAETTFANLTIALAGGTTTSGAGFEAYEPDDDNSADSPTYKAIIFDGVGGAGLRRRVFIRKALSTDNVDVSNSKEDQQVYPVTFTSHYVSAAVKSWRVVNATS